MAASSTNTATLSVVGFCDPTYSNLVMWQEEKEMTIRKCKNFLIMLF